MLIRTFSRQFNFFFSTKMIGFVLYVSTICAAVADDNWLMTAANARDY